MKRIFLTLAIIAALLLAASVLLGLNLGDTKSLDRAVQSAVSVHMLTGIGALTFAILVHAISLTYFMGTGRWIEETTQAYSLNADFYARSQRIKYGTLPGLTGCVLALIATGALGAVADPATPVSFGEPLGMSDAVIHFTVALVTFGLNLIVNLTQYLAISANSDVVDEVLAEVRRIREERGLATS